VVAVTVHRTAWSGGGQVANIVPVDEYVGEWYPGYRPEHFDFPCWPTARFSTTSRSPRSWAR
jgi:hypothetical protein